jgi:multidrug efflux pump subunit AcrB
MAFCIWNGLYEANVPIGASVAMILSLFALTVTPYLGYHLLEDSQEHKENEGLKAVSSTECITS